MHGASSLTTSKASIRGFSPSLADLDQSLQPDLVEVVPSYGNLFNDDFGSHDFAATIGTKHGGEPDGRKTERDAELNHRLRPPGVHRQVAEGTLTFRNGDVLVGTKPIISM